MNLIIAILKVLLTIVVLIALIIGGLIGYDHYETEQEKAAELNYNFGKVLDWRWHDEFHRTQIRYNKYLERSVMRRVHLDDDYEVIAFMYEDYSLIAIVTFKTECEPNTVIETTKKFSSGETKTLECDFLGKSLSFQVSWGEGEPGFWNEDLDGFVVSEDFSTWDFSKLNQEITLMKAKPKADNPAKD